MLLRFVIVYIGQTLNTFITLFFMGKVGTGAKAGLVAGLVYGIFSGIFGYATLTIYKADVMKFLAKEAATESSLNPSIHITAAELYSLEVDGVVAEAIIGGLIAGLILGIIFAYVHGKLPGKNMIIKGEMFGLILWVLFDVLLGSLDISSYGLLYYLTSIGLDIIALLIFGYLLGTLYNKWSENEAPLTDEQFNAGKL